MTIKSTAKRLVGRLAPLDFYEKLTEYATNEQVAEFSMAGAKSVQVESRLPKGGARWHEIYDGSRFEIWKQVLDRIGGDVLLLEFGVYQGASMREFIKYNSAPGSRFYGFDSFQGLPELWRGTKAGHFSTGGNIPQIDDDRVTFVPGWFQDSLPPKLEELRAMAEGRSVVVNFDADLYSSTLFLLFALNQIFSHYHFFFDEFSGHEARALYNFMQATGAKPTFSHQFRYEGDLAVVAGELHSRA